MMFCGRKDCSRCKFFKRDGCVTVPECAYKDLMEKLGRAKEALGVIAMHTVIPVDPKDRAQQIQTVRDIAKDALKGIEE